MAQVTGDSSAAGRTHKLPRSPFAFVRKLFRETGSFLLSLGEFWRASTEEQLYRHLRREIRKREDLFLLLCFGDLLGLPVPSYLSLRLLPYVLKDLELWRRRAARRRGRLWRAWEQFAREF